MKGALVTSQTCVVVYSVISMICNMVPNAVFDNVTNQNMLELRLVHSTKNSGISMSSDMVASHYLDSLVYCGGQRQRTSLGFLKLVPTWHLMTNQLQTHLNVPHTFRLLAFTVWRRFVHLVGWLLHGQSLLNQNLLPTSSTFFNLFIQQKHLDQTTSALTRHVLCYANVLLMGLGRCGRRLQGSLWTHTTTSIIGLQTPCAAPGVTRLH